MPVKRSRVGSSPGNPATSVATVASHSPVKLVKTDAASETSLQKSLAVASPANVRECERMKIGGFLEQCHYCSKRIAQGSDVFMYGNLRAFCSIKCRDCQINLDQLTSRKKAED